MVKRHWKRLSRYRACRIVVPVACSLLSAGLSVSIACAQAPTPLPTGRAITPLGTQTNIGSLPTNMILTPDGKFAIVTDTGWREYLVCLNTATGQIANGPNSPIVQGTPDPAHPNNPNGGLNDTPPNPFPTRLPNAFDPHPTSPSELVFGDPFQGSNGLYYGLAVKSNGNGSYTLYAAQGANGTVAVVSIDNTGKMTQTGTITMRTGDFPTGLSLDDNGKLYVSINVYYNGGNDPLELLTPGQVAVIDTTNNNVETARYAFNSLPQDVFGTVVIPSGNSRLPGRAQPFTPSNYPYAVAALRGGGKVYVTSERDGGVFVINTQTGAQKFISTSTLFANPNKPYGAHPIALLLNSAQDTLYVANAHEDSLSVINTATDTVTKTISLRPVQAPNIPGVTPTGLALSADGNTLYATLADMNALAQVNVTTGSVRYVPVGWYPTAVAALGDGSVLVANAKGTVPRNPNTYHLTKYPTTSPKNLSFDDTFYDEDIIEGTVSKIAASSLSNAANTETVITNNNLNRITQGDIPAENPLSGIDRLSGGITHVLYIIKENRTYDQILGDLNVGNGDPNLTLYGQTVTPNLHNLTKRFRIFDNFYDCAEVSGDGWPWSTQGQANENVIRNVPYQYSSRGRNYDFEGTNNNYPVGGFPAKNADGQQNSILFPNGAPAIPDVSEAPGGHIWDLAGRNGLTYRNYGFYVTDGSGTPARPILPNNNPGPVGLKSSSHYAGGPFDPAVYGYTDIDYRNFDLNYADSDGPAVGGPSTFPLKTYGKFNAISRFSEWNREFQFMLQAGTAQQPDKYVPNLMMLRMMQDHTTGISRGKPTPAAEVADNDYAIGQVVQAVSNSPIWNHTAIFVIEDDAQDGPDHVDCHRSTAYVISPYLGNGTPVADSRFYNTISIIKTIEDLLDLPPMNQYDATASPILGWNNAPTNNAPYALDTSALPTLHKISSLKMTPKNPLWQLAKKTEGLNLAQADAADPRLLNEILWKAAKGIDSKMPAPRHNVILTRAANGKMGKTSGKSTKQTAARDDD